MNQSENKSYLVTGTLNRNKSWKIHLSMLNNGEHNTWNRTIVGILGSDITSNYFMQQTKVLREKVSDQQLYGITSSKNIPINFTVIRKSEDSLGIFDGPIEMLIDQSKKQLRLKSRTFEYHSDKLISEDSYRIFILMGYKDAKIEMKVIH